MFELLMEAGTTYLEEISKGLLVTVLGIALVFVILALLIGVITVLRKVDSLMIVWDKMMARSRERRGLVNEIKSATKDKKEELISEIATNLTKAEIVAQKNEIIELINQEKSDNKTAIELINDLYGRISIIEKERSKAIREEKVANNSEIKAMKSNFAKGSDEFIAKKADLIAQYKSKLASINAEFDVVVALLHESNCHAEQEDCDDICECDDELIAVITAAIAIMTSAEAQAKKVQFKVRSIKQING